VPVVAEAHGGEFVREILTFLADGGTLVVWGDLSAQPWTVQTSDLLMRELNIRTVSISRWATRDHRIRAADRLAAVELADRHPELLVVGDTYPLEELQDAIASARTSKGSTLLKLS
jgi:NADPH:quinone reductase-like Zn-dependent oxidoreductase